MSDFGGKGDIEAKLLTHDEARRIAAHIAKLPLAVWARSKPRPCRRENQCNVGPRCTTRQ
jgi:hypothetical protein